MHRRSENKSRSSRRFNKRAGQTMRLNKTTIMRGGTRL